MRSRRGFTLVELLIVVAIIATLLAILVPVLDALKQWKIRLHCATNLGKIGRIVAAYAGRYGGKLPCGGTASWWESEEKSPGYTPVGRHLMIEELIDCGGSPEIFCCPAHPFYENLPDDSSYYDANMAGKRVQTGPPCPEGLRTWKPNEYAYGGAKYSSVGMAWMKYYNMPGYAMFTYSRDFGLHPSGGTVMPNRWDTWVLFGRNAPASGRRLPSMMDETGDPPIGADEMRFNPGATPPCYEGMWHFADRVTLQGNPDERQLVEFGDGGGHTLFLSGRVVWYDWNDFYEGGPQYKDQGPLYYFGGLSMW